MERELPKKGSITAAEDKHEFSQSIIYQTKLVSIRLFQQYWRSPDYLWSKFILTIFNQLFIGFTFFKAGTSLQGLQNQMLAVFMFTVISILFYNNIYHLLSSKEICMRRRERPSRTFSWISFIFAQIFVEVPWNILAGTIAYFIYYYPIGFYSNASAAGQLHERGALFWLFSCAFTFMLVLWVCLSFLSTKLQKVQLT